jgi:MmyB-like transcription regulator ligand binding domain
VGRRSRLYRPAGAPSARLPVAPWWESHDIGSITAGRKRLSHPKKGSLRFEYATFQANDDPALKLVIYMPV